MNRKMDELLEAGQKRIMLVRAFPSRELDALVGQEVLGHQIVYGPGSKYGDYLTEGKLILPSYSTNPQHAMCLIDYFMSFEVFHVTTDMNTNGCCVSVYTKPGHEIIAQGTGETWMHAMCNAALTCMDKAKELFSGTPRLGSATERRSDGNEVGRGTDSSHGIPHV